MKKKMQVYFIFPKIVKYDKDELIEAEWHIYVSVNHAIHWEDPHDGCSCNHPCIVS